MKNCTDLNLGEGLCILTFFYFPDSRLDLLNGCFIFGGVTIKIRFRNPEKFCLWNPESWALESGIQLRESGIPLTIEIQNPSSTDKY